MKNSYRNMYTDVRVLRIKGQPSKCQLTTCYAANSVNDISINFSLLIAREKYNFCNRTLLCNPLLMCLVINLFAFCFSVFQAASLSINNEFKSGRLLAYKLMCAMTVSRQDMPLSQEYLTHFYRLMHIGLTGTDQVRFHKK